MNTPRQDYASNGTTAVIDVPRFVSFTSPVSLNPGEIVNGQLRPELPLNIVALITQYLHDVADLARLTRTCRLLYYMTLPQLYQRVILRSYPEIRYVNGRPEGFGGGSPFVMALNGMVTQTHAAVIEEFRVTGQWREAGQEDFAKGRVPDNSMMLNILLRAATDKMVKLRTFSWELDCKPLKTLYKGLAAHNTLTSLTINFPNTRVPRPSVMIPPIPNLRAFKALDIDPLCYPDDISMLLLGSKKLEDLRLRFSPRMRRESEPSVNLQTYFGRVIKAGVRMKLKHYAMQNFFGTTMEGCDCLVDKEVTRSFTAIDNFGGIGTASSLQNVYLDNMWKDIPTSLECKFEVNRTNEVAPEHLEIVRRNQTRIKRLYLTGARLRPPADKTIASPITPEESVSVDEELSRLGREYLYELTRKHGASLQHLLLREEWALDADEIADLVRYCPNLEQLGIAMSTSNHAILRLLLPFLPSLKAVRLLQSEGLAEHMREITHEQRMSAMSVDLGKAGVENLRWLGIGDAVYRVGRKYQYVKEDGAWEWRREVTWSSKEEVQHVEIWGMDNVDISAEPVAPFDP